MKIEKFSTLLVGAMLGMTSVASAEEDNGCTSAKDFVNLIQSFYGANPELKNVITPTVRMELRGLNGNPTPSHILYRHEGEEYKLPVVDGDVQDLETGVGWSKDGEFCRLIDGEIPPASDEDTTQASVNFSFPYLRKDGVFSIDEIKEGAKDGSKVMKGLAPSGLGFAVPGLKALALVPAEGVEDIPTMSFSRDGEPVDVKIYTVGSTQLVRLKDIKSSKADKLNISGKYILNARFKFDAEEVEAEQARRLAEDADGGGASTAN